MSPDRDVAHVHLPEDDEDVRSPQLVKKRELSDQQWSRFERYMGEIFGAFGMDMGQSGTKDTPRRFVRALYDATEGYEGDPKVITALARTYTRRVPLGCAMMIQFIGRV